MTPVGARSRAPTGVVFSQAKRGSAPLAAEHILPLCFLTFTQLSLVADDCKKLLVESMNAFLEPIRDRRKAWTKTPSSSGTCSKPATPKQSGCAQEKAELYLLERRRCLRRQGAQPRTPTWKTMTPVGAQAARQQASLFSPSGFQRGSAPLAAGGILPLCFVTFTQLSLVADDCKKLLVESMNAFLEPIRDRRKALDKDPKLVWDMLPEAGNAKVHYDPRQARNLDLRSRKS